MGLTLCVMPYLLSGHVRLVTIREHLLTERTQGALVAGDDQAS